MRRYILTTLFTFSLIFILFPAMSYGISMVIQQFSVPYQWLVLVIALFIMGILSGALSAFTFYARLFPALGYKVYEVEKPKLPFNHVIKDRWKDIITITLLANILNIALYAWFIYVSSDILMNWQAIIQFFLCFFILDAWFYWSHAIFHHLKRLFLIHKTHHIILVHEQVPFITKPLDDLVIPTLSFVVAFLILNFIVGEMYTFIIIYLYSIWFFLIVPAGHSNVEFFTPPVRWLLGGPWLSTSVTYHSLHHTRFKENYGAWSMLWDRLMGTVSPDYEAIYQRVINEQPLTSIRERLDVKPVEPPSDSPSEPL